MGRAGWGAPQRGHPSGEAGTPFPKGGGVKGGLGTPAFGTQRLLSCASSELRLIPKGDRKKRSKTQTPEDSLSACEGTGTLQYSPVTLPRSPLHPRLPKVLVVWGGRR